MDKLRVSDTTMLVYARQALLLLLSKRPDLFFGKFSALPDLSALGLTDSVPVNDMLSTAIADYITARSETGNDESVVEQRAVMFFGLFKEVAAV